MAVIKSGASTDELSIDATSKAARITLYDSAGNKLNIEPTGVYSAPINMGSLTGGIAGGSAIWAMRNPAGSAKTIKILRINMFVGFSGVAALTTAIYDFCRFSAATHAGGSVITTIKHKSNYAATAVTDVRQNAAAALTDVGVSYETGFISAGCPRQLGALTALSLTFEEAFWHPFDLAPGEGMSLRVNVATVAGDSFTGNIKWAEI